MRNPFRLYTLIDRRNAKSLQSVESFALLLREGIPVISENFCA